MPFIYESVNRTVVKNIPQEFEMYDDINQKGCAIKPDTIPYFDHLLFNDINQMLDTLNTGITISLINFNVSVLNILRILV